MSIPHPYLYAALEVLPQPSANQALKLSDDDASLVPVAVQPDDPLPPIELTTLQDLFFLTNQESEETTPLASSPLISTQKQTPATYYAPSTDKLVLLKQKKAEAKHQLDYNDAEELHDAKVAASWWGCIPFLPAVVAMPFLPTLFYAVRSPQELAAKRTDERRGYRSLADATAHEEAIKTAQIKASLLPCALVTLGILGREQLPFQREWMAPLKEQFSVATLEVLEKWLPKVLEALSWGAIGIPFATMIWDKPVIQQNKTPNE